MADLTAPLDDAQQALLGIVWPLFREHGKFPVYCHVEHRMKGLGYDLAETLASLPALSMPLYRGRYRAVDFESGGGAATPDSVVYLTMAGVRHALALDPGANAFVGVFMTWLRMLSGAEEKYAESPFEVPNVSVSIEDAMTEAGMDPALTPWVVAMSLHEWPGVRTNYQSGAHMGSLGSIGAHDYFTIEDYLGRVAALMPPPQQTSVFESHDPNALPRTLTHFDVTCELVLKRVLIRKPALSRTAWFSQDAGSLSDFQAGMSALGELIADLDVPPGGKYPLGRLAAYLEQQLPKIDKVRIAQAIELIDAVREIRNSSVHSKPSKVLIAAHQRLGLTYPIQDPTLAWQTVRAQMDAAFTILQEEILAAR